MKIINKKIKKIYILALGVFFAFESSFSYFTNHLFYKINTEEYSNVGNILSSLQFWAFLFAEIAVLLYLNKKTEKKKSERLPVKYVSLTVALFLFSVTIFFISLAVHKESASTFEAMMFCVSTFLFHLMFIINSKLFLAIFAEERNKTK